MKKEQLIEECLKAGESFLDYPFDATCAVIKVQKNGKMFAFMDYANAEKLKKSCGADTPVEDGDLFINLKCTPELSEVMRKKYAAVVPGYYCNKAHMSWNTIIVGKDVPFDEIKKLIGLSYELVSSKK